MVKLVDHMRLGRPEALRKGNELLRRQSLVAQHEYLIRKERALELRKRCAGERPRHVGVVRLETKTVTERT